MSESPSTLNGPQRSTRRGVIVFAMIAATTGLLSLSALFYAHPHVAGALNAPGGWHGPHVRQRRMLFPKMERRRWLKHRHVLGRKVLDIREPMPAHHLDRG